MSRPPHNQPSADPAAAAAAAEPEKEPVRFDVDLRGAPDQVVALVHHIRDVGEQLLYHWKIFPIILPPPLACSSGTCKQCNNSGIGSHINAFEVSLDNPDGNGYSLSLGRRHKHLNMRDLFVAPSFDELDAVAVDAKGEPHRLNSKQLEAVRERGLDKDKFGKPKKLNSSQLETVRRWGEFEVDSLNFPGQSHKWRLSQLLQKGTERSRESLLNDVALALRFILVTARARFTSHFFSVSQSLRSLLAGLLRLLDIVVGIPSLQAHNLDAKIREERSHYLVAELVCRPELEDSLEVLCGFVRKQVKRATMEKFEVERESCQPPVPVPYLFLTPKGIELDLRLFSRDIMKKALPILVNILERETRGWFLHFRERLISELRTKKLPDEEIEKEVKEAVMHEYLQRVYASVLTHPDLEGIAQLLVQQAQSVVLMHRAVENVQRKLLKTKENLKQRLELQHPVLSRIEPWMRDKLRRAEVKFIQDCQWSAHEEALSLCTNQHLHQTVYFLNRDLAFMREREPVMLRELGKVKIPTRNFSWLTRIWLPTNWIVRRNFQGQSDVIPTVLSSQVTSITTPRSDPSQPVFVVEKDTVCCTTTRWPLWRLINYCHRTWAWTWNAMFFFGVVLPWCSPVSFRALFSTDPFMPDLELSQVNGTLFPRKSSLTPTLCSRLLQLWRHISKSRTHFETKPDTGFIGKGFTRHVNRVWNYFVKGLLGTLVVAIVFPAVCMFASAVSLVVAATAVMWMPIGTLIFHALMILICDLDSPDASRNRWFVVLEALIWNIALQGLMQPIVALLVALVICPLISLSIMSVGVCRYGFRLMWDALLFHLLIKKRGRIPACDSLLVKRVAGPGLNSNYYYQIRPEQALAAFEAKMELDELSAYQYQTEQTILQPQKDYCQFVEACFGPFSAQLSGKADPYRELEKEAADLMSCLHEKLERRRHALHTGLAVHVRNRIKLTTHELRMTVQQAALLLERFYPSHILRLLPISEEEFWESKGLAPLDWAGLAGLMFADVFSYDFLTPLDDTDTRFRLEPHPQVDLSRYTDLLQSADLNTSRPDILGPVYSPKANIQVHSPYLDVSVFNPRVRPLGGKQNRRIDGSGMMGSRLRARKLGEAASSATATATATTTGPTDRLTVPNTGTVVEASPEEDPSTKWQPWKRHCVPFRAEKLVIPLPVPHPAHIAVTIFNRDSEDPIPLNDELCQDILRAVEDAYGFDVESGPIGTRFDTRVGESSFDSAASRSSISSDGSRPTTVGEVFAEDCSGGMVTLRRDGATLLAGTIPPSPEDYRREREPGPGPGPGSGAEMLSTSEGGSWAAGVAPTALPPATSSATGGGGYNWRPTDWAGVMRRKRNNSGTVRVDLASPEDVTLDTDATCVVFSSYGTTV